MPDVNHYRIPKSAYNLFIEVIRNDQLDGVELHDIAVSIDAGETEFTGPGKGLWEHVQFFAHYYLVSATYLIDETCVCLGWG